MSIKLIGLPLLAKKNNNKIVKKLYVKILIFFSLFYFFAPAIFAEEIGATDYLAEEKSYVLSGHKFFFDETYSLDYYKSASDDVTTRTHKFDNFFTWRPNNKIKVMASIPYDFIYDTDGNSANGFEDITLYFWYQFYRKNNLSLIIMPEVSLPDGNYNQGLGTGRVDPGAMFTVVKDWKKFTLSSSVEYIRYENKIDYRTNIWKIYVTPKYRFTENFLVFLGGRMEDDGLKEGNYDGVQINSYNPIFVNFGFTYNFNKSISITPVFETSFVTPNREFTAYLDLTFGLDTVK